MNILFVSSKPHPLLEQLVKSLNQTGLQVELTTELHPLRFLLNKYHLIHFFEFEAQLSQQLQNLFLSFTAKKLGIGTIVSFMLPQSLKGQIQNILQNQALSGMTFSQTSDLKHFRSFKGHKMVLPLLPHRENLKKTTRLHEHSTTQPRALLLNCSETKSDNFFTEQLFNELLVYKPLIEKWTEFRKNKTRGSEAFSTEALSAETPFQIYVHVNFLSKAALKSSELRKKWLAFTQQNPAFENCALITQQKNLDELFKSHLVYNFIAHQVLSAENLVNWVSYSVRQEQFLILNEDQASGLATFWQTSKNCYITSQQLTHFSQTKKLVEYFNTEVFHKKNSTFEENSAASSIHLLETALDLKINELVRFYSKINLQSKVLVTESKTNSKVS